MKNYYKYTLSFLLVFIVMVVVWFFFNKTSKESLSVNYKTYTIILTENGFEPSKLEVNAGDTVIFRSSVGDKFWPASDPHPVHTGYAEFDPGRALNSSEEWIFTFNNVGVWAFHDHLGVSRSGVISVKENRISSSICDKNLQENATCFDEELRSIVRKSGINAAFALLAQKYDVGDIPVACHWSAHKIGEETYLEEERGRPLVLTSQTYYCGYGFFHGYLEVMLRKNPYPEKQKEKIVYFCDTAQKQIGGEARDNCYHGIGSGFTENPPDPKVWGKPEELVLPGLQICEKLFGKSREWEMCTTGVFAVLVNFMSDNQYDFSFDKSQPFEFCAGLEEGFHRACYGEFAAKLESITKGDLRLVSSYVKNVNDKIGKLIVNVAAAAMMQSVVVKDDQTVFISDCRLFSPELQPSCIDGIVWGFLYHGRINEEHVKAFKFCNSNLFDSKEQDFCYQRLVARAKNMYSEAKFDKICSLLKREYQHYCEKSLLI